MQFIDTDIFNPNAKKDALTKIQLVDGLVFFGGFELENTVLIEKFKLDKQQENKLTGTLQLGLEYEFNDFMSIEVAVEAEGNKFNTIKTTVDEGFISIDLDDWSFSVGLQDVPFSESESYFINEPSIAFAELNQNSLLIEYSPWDDVEFSAFAFKGKFNTLNESQSIDYGFNANYESKRLSLGVGYLSDLSESDENLLSDVDNRYQHRVDALSYFVKVNHQSVSLLYEASLALGLFVELDDNMNSPFLHNIEVSYLPLPWLQLAMRYEINAEIEEQPERLYGVGVNYVLAKKIYISANYLIGKFDHSRLNISAEDNEDNASSHNQFDFKLIIEF